MVGGGCSVGRSSEEEVLVPEGLEAKDELMQKMVQRPSRDLSLYWPLE